MNTSADTIHTGRDRTNTTSHRFGPVLSPEQGEMMAHTDAPTAAAAFAEWAERNMASIDRREARQPLLQASDGPLDTSDYPDWLRDLAARQGVA